MRVGDPAVAVGRPDGLSTRDRRLAETNRRLAEVRRALAALERRPGALVVVSPEHPRYRDNLRYLTGFTGSSGAAVVTTDKAIFVTDFRYLEQAAQECAGWEIIAQGPVMVDTVAEVLTKLGEERVGFERQWATFALYEELATRLKGYELVPVGPVVEQVRLVKTEDEIALIREAAAITDKALGEVLPLLRPGIAERDVATEIAYRMRKLGADEPAFPTIVASGVRSAMPHGEASGKALAAGDFVTVDTGAMYKGYCSDLTRTFVLGGATEEQKKVYELVREAQAEALAAVKAGRTGKQIDAVARDIIAAAGHGQHFGHGLGHGVGLAVHEGPRLSPTYDLPLEPGEVVTVEPGVYVTGWGGVRIEDLVVVRADGGEVLSKFPKELTVL